MSQNYLLGQKGMEAYGETVCTLVPPSGWAEAAGEWVRPALLIRTEKPGHDLLVGRQLADSDCFAFSSAQPLVEIKNHLRSLHELIDCRGGAGFWPWYRGDCLLALLQVVRRDQLSRILGPIADLWFPQAGFHRALMQPHQQPEPVGVDSNRTGSDSDQSAGVLSLSQPEHWALQQWMRLRIESEAQAVRRKLQIEEGLDLPSVHLSRTLGRISRVCKRPSAFELAAASLLSEELEFETRHDPLGFTLQICEAWLEAGYPPSAASLLYERLGAFRYWDSPILHSAPVPFPLNYVDLLRRKLSYLGEAKVYGLKRSGRRQTEDPSSLGQLAGRSSILLREWSSNEETVFMPVEETSSESMHLKWFDEDGKRAATLALGDRGDFVEFGDLQALQVAIVQKALEYAGMQGWDYFDSPVAASSAVYWIPRMDRSCWLHVQDVSWVDVRLRRQVLEIKPGTEGGSPLQVHNWYCTENLEEESTPQPPFLELGHVIGDFSKPVPLQSMDVAVLDWEFASDKESAHLAADSCWGWHAEVGRPGWRFGLSGQLEAAVDHRLFRLSVRLSFEGMTLNLTVRLPDSSTLKRNLAVEYSPGEMHSSDLVVEELVWPLQAEMTPVDAMDGSRLQLADRKAGELIAKVCLRADPGGVLQPVIAWMLPAIEPCIEIRRPHGGIELARLALTQPQELGVWGGV